jgi:hypothetical protein
VTKWLLLWDPPPPPPPARFLHTKLFQSFDPENNLAVYLHR